MEKRHTLSRGLSGRSHCMALSPLTLSRSPFSQKHNIPSGLVAISLIWSETSKKSLPDTSKVTLYRLHGSKFVMVYSFISVTTSSPSLPDGSSYHIIFTSFTHLGSVISNFHLTEMDVDFIGPVLRTVILARSETYERLH